MLERWYRLRRFERSGRIYRALGLVALFARIAAVFGETLPDPTVATLSREKMERLCARARYHELVNVISVLVQLPLLAMAWHVGQPLLVVYSLILLIPHVISIMLERYKRAVLLDLIAAGTPAREGIVRAADASPQPERPHTGWFFGPFPCETELLYVRIGVERFRRFVLWLMKIASASEGGSAFRNVTGGRAGLAAFDAETRTAELTHLLGTTLHVPFAVVFWRERYSAGLVFVLFLWWLNLICALLQRQHRVRLQLLLRRCRTEPREGAGA